MGGGEAKMDLWEAFSELPDPRTGPAQRHDLREMIVMALAAAVFERCFRQWI